MTGIHLIAVGNLKEAYLRAGAAEYQKRLGGLCACTVTEVQEARLPRNPSEREIAAALAAEGQRILSAVPKGAFLVPLCVEGVQITSEQLAQQLETAALSGKHQAAFVIGSSFGLSPEVKAAGDFRLSMSRMTLPHQLCRLVLLEQLYRAGTILTGRKYHK